MNNASLIGRLTGDVEVKELQGRDGNPFYIGKFNLALNKKVKGADGTYTDKVSFVECKTLGNQAKTIAQYFKKGDRIGVNCEIEQETWVDKTTNANRSKIVFIVNSFDFIERNDKAGTQGEIPVQVVGQPQANFVYQPQPQGVQGVAQPQGLVQGQPIPQGEGIPF